VKELESDLEESAARAERVLGRKRFDHALEEAEAEGGRAADREAWHWVLGLLLGAVVVAAFVANWWLLLVAIPLIFLFALPLVVAGRVDAQREAESEALRRAAREADRRRGR